MYEKEQSKSNKHFSQSRPIKELQCAPLTITQQGGIKPHDAIQGSAVSFFRRMYSTASKSSTNGFTINIDEKMKFIKEIRFLHASVRFAFGSTIPEMLYVYFDQFPAASARTGTGYEYHCAIPTRNAIQVGAFASIHYIFPDHYVSYVGSQIHLKKFRVKLYYEDKHDNGIFKPFNLIDYFDFEVLFK